MSDQPIFKPTRRTLIKGLVSASGTALLGSRISDVLAQGVAPAAVTSERLRPQLPGGVMSGDITADSAIVWSRTDRPARMIVEYSTDTAFKNVVRRVGPAALESGGLTAR
jgi:alkaline phosphatase D